MRSNNNPFIVNTNIGNPSTLIKTKLARIKSLTKTDHLNILEKRLINKESGQQIAKDFSISPSTVYRLQN